MRDGTHLGGRAGLVEGPPAAGAIPRTAADATMATPVVPGTAGRWLDSVADGGAFAGDPECRAVVAPAERVFADVERTRFLLTREEGVVP